MRTGFKYSTKYVQHKETSKGSLTRFQTGEKIKDAESYQNWSVVCFENLDIKDGDKVVIDSIDSVEAREYNGKIYYDIVAKAHKHFEVAQAVSTDNPFDV